MCFDAKVTPESLELGNMMRRLSISLLSLLALNSHANVLQYFTGISYSNPSDLFKIKKTTWILGATGFYSDLRFDGSVLNLNTLQYDRGTSYSRTYTLLPYGRFAKRINDKTVIAVDVTEPFNSNLNWGTDSFTRYANTQNYLTDVDLNPKFSFEISRNISVGAGINLNFLRNNEVNWAFPTSSATYANLINKSSSYGTGYNLGLTYSVNPRNILGLAYFSRIRQNTTGRSILGTAVNDQYRFGFYMPATTIISYTHLFNPEWLISLQGFWTQWSANQQVRLYNTAAPTPSTHFTFDMNYSESRAFLGVVRKQFNKKLGISLAGMIDDGPEQNHLRTITFPAYTQYFFGISGDYHVTAHSSIELVCGHVFSFPRIQNRISLNEVQQPFTTGKVSINADVVDLKLKIEG